MIESRFQSIRRAFFAFMKKQKVIAFPIDID
jgi:hypothetical protein